MKLSMLRKRLDNPKTETLQQSLETKFAQLGHRKPESYKLEISKNKGKTS